MVDFLMSLQSSRSRLSGLSKELSRQWQAVQEVWLDSKGKEFNSNYMQALFDDIDSGVAAMEQLDKVLKKLKQDCEL